MTEPLTNKFMIILTEDDIIPVRTQVLDQVGNQVRDQVKIQVWDQVGNQVSDQVRSQVWDQVGNQVRSQIINQ